MQTENFDFWKNQEEAKNVQKEISDLEKEIKNWSDIETETQNLAEFADLAEKENDEGILNEMAEKLRTLESKFDKLEIQTFLSEKYDKNNALLTISSGVGGRDSQDWASMLFRMYNRYCESKEW